MVRPERVLVLRYATYTGGFHVHATTDARVRNDRPTLIHATLTLIVWAPKGLNTARNMTCGRQTAWPSLTPA
jgi:hypothetical protein